MAWKDLMDAPGKIASGLGIRLPDVDYKNTAMSLGRVAANPMAGVANAMAQDTRNLLAGKMPDGITGRLLGATQTGYTGDPQTRGGVTVPATQATTSPTYNVSEFSAGAVGGVGGGMYRQPSPETTSTYNPEEAEKNAKAAVKGFGQTGVASQMGLRGLVKNADGTWSASPELQQALMGNETAEQTRLKNVALNDARERFGQEAAMREKFAGELRQEKENQLNFDANIGWALNNPNAPNAQAILAQLKQGRKVGAVVNEAAPMQQFSDAQRMMGLKESEAGSQNLLRSAQAAKEQADASSLGGFRGAMSKMYASQGRMYDSEAANKPLHYLAEIEKARASAGGKNVGAKDVYEGYIKARADATKALEGNPAYMSATPEAKNEMLDTVAKQTMSGAQMQVEAMNPLSPDRIKAMQSDILKRMGAEKDSARYSALNNQLLELRKYKAPGA